jgi:hypothetical protein
MTGHDFQWLADRIERYFPADASERGIDLLGELQERLEEFETDRQRRQIRELGEEFLRREEAP